MFTELNFSDLSSRPSAGYRSGGGVGVGLSAAHNSALAGGDRSEREYGFTELAFSDLSSRLSGVHRTGGVGIYGGDGGGGGQGGGTYSSITQLGSGSDFTVLSVGVGDRSDLGPVYCSSPSTTDDESDGSTVESVIDRRGALYT